MLRNSVYQHMPIDVNGIVDILNKSNIIEHKKFNSNIEAVSTYLDKSFSLNNFHDGFEDYFEDDIENMSNRKKLLNKEPKTTLYRIRARRCFVPMIFNYLLIKLMYLAVSVGIFGIIDLIFR